MGRAGWPGLRTPNYELCWVDTSFLQQEGTEEEEEEEEERQQQEWPKLVWGHF